MELNSQINTFSKGMNLDTDIAMLPEGQYRYAENIRLLADAESTTGVLQNIEYIRQYNGGIPSDETIIGTATTMVYDDTTKGPIECGIVLTKKIVNTNIYNILYKITGFNSVSLTTEIITQGFLKLENNVSIVTNYESDKVSNIYICDGLTPIKVINIYDEDIDPDEVIYDHTRFDITPGCILFPFTFVNTIGGALPAGAVQYCYQLFNQNGPETTTSALSEVIPITRYDHAGGSAKILGQTKGELSDRGCQITAKFKNDGRFDRARIFSIIYLDNTSIPDIYIINEVEIPRSDNSEFIEFTYNDTGASIVSKLTVDEFNAMVPFEFNAKVIEKMNNRLFAANVQELTWDIPDSYDTRAYRCNSSGHVLLQSSNSANTISATLTSTGLSTSVPKEHDCINPSNVDVLGENVYQYAYDRVTRGGTGENISYRFVYAEIDLSSASAGVNSMVGNVELNAQSGVSNITIVNESGTIIKSIPTPNGRAIVPNYSDPYICANYLGYQRDEVYRFGIIFYNDKNIPSPVHWIADIRMPDIKQTSYSSSCIYPFHTGALSNNYIKTAEQVGYALGVEFTVKNLPESVKSYEIVRCDRNEIDRTVVTQGIMGALFKFTGWSGDEKEPNLGENDTRPAPMFNLSTNFRTKFKHGGGAWDFDDEHTAVPGYFEFVSPEVCVKKDSILQNIQNNYITPLYKVSSVYGNRVSISQKYVYNVASDSGAGDKNDDKFGTIDSKDGVYYLNTGKGRGNDGYGYAGVFKYYNITTDKSIQSNLKIEDSIVSRTLPYFMNLNDAKGHAQSIGNRSYVNTSIGGYKQIGNHGVSAILQLPESFYPYKEPTSDPASYCTAIIANVKQNIIPYGGNTYISRQSSVYNSCGCSSYNQSTVMCFGGDTYLCVLDYLNTSMIQTSNDTKELHENRLCCINYIPLESQVNLNLRSDDCYHRSASGMMGPNLVQHEPCALPNGYTQKKPYYEYNPVYSATSGSKQYVSKSIYAIDDQKNQTRIVASELKTNNEMTDSWTKFKFANYLDVDTKYGQITNLKAFNDKLIYWQASAVGVASVNERSLVVDNNMSQITLGTSGILPRFDYTTTLNGSSIVNDKSITCSSSSIYWYDFDKNEICAMGETTLSLSKLKSVQTYLNQLPRSAKTNAVSFYDKKFNEVWFRIYNKTLIYNEQLQAFTSFYTHNPNWFFPFSDKLVTIKNNNMYYLHNIHEIDDSNQPREERISKVEFVVNKDISNTKVFDNVVFSAELENIDAFDSPMIKDIIFKTKTQETSALTINDIDLREDNYRFAIPREKVSNEGLNKLASQSYLGRMRGKYLICDYTFDCNNNREFKLPYIKTTYRYSML